MSGSEKESDVKLTFNDDENDKRQEKIPIPTVSTDGSTADVEDDEEVGSGKERKKRKVKRKKIYFRSDFVGDESSSDEDDKNNALSKTISQQNPHDLNWAMWFWYYIVVASVSTFHAAEFCGEKLADFFGITAPKYQYAINEYHRLKQEEREEEEREQREAECVRQRELERLTHLEGGNHNERVPNVKFNHD